MDIDSKKLKSIAPFFDPETDNETILKQHWIRIDNEEWESIEKIMKRYSIWDIEQGKIEKIMKQPLVY